MKLRRRKRYREAEIQRQCVAWFRVAHPDQVLIYINNNSPSPAAAIRNKKMGLTAGFPDLFLFYQSDQYSGLAIELKRPGGAKPKKHQLALHDRLTELGYLVVVVRSLDTFRRVVTDYLGANS
jgi:hypothetical protein